MTYAVDVFWSFRSPYSYLVTPDLLRLREDFEIGVHVRPVFPIAVRSKATLFTGDRRRVQYIVIDSRRRAEFLGMKIAHPTPDPVVQEFNTFEVSADQPYIHRLTGLGVEAERRGKGIESAYHVSHLVWGGEPGWNEGDRLAQAVAKAGLDLAELDAAITAKDPRPKSKPIRQRLKRSAAGACRPWCSMASPTSAKTGSTRCAGGWSRPAFRNASIEKGSPKC